MTKDIIIWDQKYNFKSENINDFLDRIIRSLSDGKFNFAIYPHGGLDANWLFLVTKRDQAKVSASIVISFLSYNLLSHQLNNSLYFNK